MRHLLKTISIVIAFFLTNNLLGQTEVEVKKLLLLKDFKTFSLYVDTFQERNKKIRLGWTYLRNLTKEYQEGVVYFTRRVPSKRNPKIKLYEPFLRVRLIANDNEIIYFELGKIKNEFLFFDWIPDYLNIDTYKNDSMFNFLRQSFKQSFSAELKEKELFLENTVYGQDCGSFDGTFCYNPKEKIIMDKFVSKLDKKDIIKWLKSTNTEKQLYAVEGLYHLKLKGIVINDNELEIIKNVLDKKGSILVCSPGTDKLSINIEWVINRFNF